MRQQITITIFLSVVLSITVVVKLTFFPLLNSQTAYFFLSIFWICGVLVVIFLLNILWHLFDSHKSSRPHEFGMGWPNRRKTYRIIYPSHMRPKLIVESADNQIKRQLEYLVIDLSQDGLCFIDDGSLGPVQSLTGRLIFQSSESTPIKGLVLRKQNNQICVQLKQGLDWPMIITEQRRLLTGTKGAG
jgi:hypothetical protein